MRSLLEHKFSQFSVYNQQKYKNKQTSKNYIEQKCMLFILLTSIRARLSSSETAGNQSSSSSSSPLKWELSAVTEASQHCVISLSTVHSRTRSHPQPSQLSASEDEIFTAHVFTVTLKRVKAALESAVFTAERYLWDSSCHIKRQSGATCLSIYPLGDAPTPFSVKTSRAFWLVVNAALANKTVFISRLQNITTLNDGNAQTWNLLYVTADQQAATLQPRDPRSIIHLSVDGMKSN